MPITARQLAAALKRIPDLKIGKHGQLQEWSEDYDEPSPGMSHVSHLFALFPADEITLRSTPELAQAARISLERRVQNGGGKNGWPAAWYVNLWARLEDGDRAYQHVRNVLTTSAESLLNANRRYFQIDANFGVSIRHCRDALAESLWRDLIPAGLAFCMAGRPLSRTARSRRRGSGRIVEGRARGLRSVAPGRRGRVQTAPAARSADRRYSIRRPKVANDGIRRRLAGAP